MYILIPDVAIKLQEFISRYQFVIIKTFIIISNYDNYYYNYAIK